MTEEAPPPFGGARLIADKSAWTKARHPAVRERWERAYRDGQIISCSIVDLELLYSARNADEFTEIEAELQALEHVPIGSDELATAVRAMRNLAKSIPATTASRFLISSSRPPQRFTAWVSCTTTATTSACARS